MLTFVLMSEAMLYFEKQCCIFREKYAVYIPCTYFYRSAVDVRLWRQLCLSCCLIWRTTHVLYVAEDDHIARMPMWKSYREYNNFIPLVFANTRARVHGKQFVSQIRVASQIVRNADRSLVSSQCYLYSTSRIEDNLRIYTYRYIHLTYDSFVFFCALFGLIHFCYWPLLADISSWRHFYALFSVTHRVR